MDDLGLDAVGVLVFVDEDVVEARTDRRTDRGCGHRLGPPDEEIVEIEHVLRLLFVDVGREEPPERLGVLAAPRERVGEDGGERPARVDGARVDREARRLLRKTTRTAREREALAEKMEQVLRVGAVVDGERGVEADGGGDAAQQPRADAVEGAAPRQPRRALQRGETERVVQRTADATLHLERGAPREREQQQPVRVGTGEDEAGDPRGERHRLARARPGDDEQRGRLLRRRTVVDAESGGAPLRVVQAVEEGGGARGQRRERHRAKALAVAVAGL